MEKSEKLEKAVTVDFKKHSAQKVWTRSGSVDPRFAAGLPFARAQILEFEHFAIQELLQFSEESDLGSLVKFKVYPVGASADVCVCTHQNAKNLCLFSS